MKIDYQRAVFLFEQASLRREQRFYLISQCCNLLEMKAILKYGTCREPCSARTVLQVCVSFYCRHSTRARDEIVGGWGGHAVGGGVGGGTGNKFRELLIKNVIRSNRS